MKKFLFLTVILLFPFMLRAQRIFATSEKEMYEIFEKMLDSTVQANMFSKDNLDYFSVSAFREIENKDTLMKFELGCPGNRNERDHTCGNFYHSYISNSMPILFYEQFFNYLIKLGNSANYYIKDYATNPLYCIREILIKQYESKKFNINENLKAWDLIEQITLRIVNEDYNYYVILNQDNKYMTDKIQQALINAIENPFYPDTYLNFYMNQQDTAYIDTAGIPDKVKREFTKHNRAYFPPSDLDYCLRLDRFFYYKETGEKNGISPGQAYLKEKRDKFPLQGYLKINIIAEYARKENDTLLIKHLKAFKKKYPDYPLKYF